MDEKTQQTEKASSTNTETGDQPEASGLIDKANTAAEKLAIDLKKYETLISRHEEVIAKELLSGRADAGTLPPKEKPLTEEEYANKMMKGEVNPLKEDGFKA